MDYLVSIHSEILVMNWCFLAYKTIQLSMWRSILLLNKITMYVIRPKPILQAKVKQLAQITMVPTLATMPFFLHPSSMGNSL